MTVTPDGYVSDETGEFVQTGHTIEGSAIGEQLRTEEVRHQEERFVVDEQTGEAHYDNTMTDADYETLIESYGGESVYAEVSDWAALNFSQADIDGFNAIIDSGDLSEIANAIDTVYNHYQARTSDAETVTDEAIQQSTEDWVFETLMPQPEYEQMISKAREALDDEAIEQYNSIMESGDREMIGRTIEMMRNQL